MKADPKTILPMWDKVLIRQVPVDEKIGNIILPDSKKESEQHAAIYGEVVAIGETAFTFTREGEKGFTRFKTAPSVGDRVMFRKYAGGNFIDGTDGEIYRMVDETDVIAKVFK